jgi:glycosyl transferase family 25
MEAWRKCIECNQPTLIFEDDFIIDSNFDRILETLLEEFTDWDLVRLQALCDSTHQVIREFRGFSVVRNDGDPLGATAYLVNPISAKKLLDESTEIFEPLDHYIEHHEKNGLTMLAVKPYPVNVVDLTRQTSTITDRPERLPIRGISKLRRSLYRIFDRLTSDDPWFPR